MPAMCTKENIQSERSLTARRARARETAGDQKVTIFRGSRIEGVLIEEER